MNSVKKASLIAILVIYEFLLIDYAANNFSLARNWFVIVGSMPVSESNIEFVIFIGQIPPLLILGWLWSQRSRKLEKDLLNKYGRTKNGSNT